jgi:hypothetical protein
MRLTRLLAASGNRKRLKESRVKSPEQYLDSLEARLADDGCQPRWEEWPGGRVLIGRRADFRIQWMATRLHLFTVAAAFPEVSVTSVEDFTRSAQRYSVDHKGGLPVGLQTGIAIFPCLVSEHVHPDALAWAEAKQVLQRAVIARPVVVDVARGIIGAFRRTEWKGAIYGAHLRRKISLYFNSALNGSGLPSPRADEP